jgi:hypothetical protein
MFPLGRRAETRCEDKVCVNGQLVKGISLGQRPKMFKMKKLNCNKGFFFLYTNNEGERMARFHETRHGIQVSSLLSVVPIAVA